jgi:hypothetical protein
MIKFVKIIKNYRLKYLLHNKLKLIKKKIIIKLYKIIKIKY